MCAMNPRLLRPLATGGFDADALAYITAVQAADGQALEQGVKVAINDFIVGCKSDGIWDSIKASCILAGARTLAGALVPLVGTAPTNNNFVSGDYDRETGLAGNGSTKYLDSNRANDADPQDDNHNAIYLAAAPSDGSNGNYFGSDGISTSGGNNMFPNITSLGGANRGVGGSNAYNIVGGEGLSLGFKGVSRAASTGYTVRTGNADNAITATSSTPTSRDVFILARNDASSPPLFVSDARLAFYSIGESLDLEALDTRVSALITAIGAAI